MGFERMCCVLQKKDSVYDTDLFTTAIQNIKNYLQLSSSLSPAHQRRVRIIADHARTAFMLINDGLIPSNIGAGYVLRMIIRRMVYNVMLLHDTTPLTKGGRSEATGGSEQIKYTDFLRDLLASFQGLREFKEEEIIRVLMEEIKLFQKTLQAGKKMLEEVIIELTSQP
jgi:alanyl-tRNA synthetase